MRWLALAVRWAVTSGLGLFLLGTAVASAEENRGQREGTERGVCRCDDTLKPLSDPDPGVRKLLAAYDFPPDPFPWSLRLQETGQRYSVYHLTFPSPVRSELVENNTVHGEYYVPRGAAGRMPAVVLLHIMDESFLLERMICRYLALGGVAALMLEMPYYADRRPAGASLHTIYVGEPLRILQAMRSAVLETRRAACWLQKRPEVDPSRIGLVGVSLGAIVGGLAAGVDPRFHRTVLVLGGGDPAHILWHADETRSIRDRLIQLGYTRERLREAAEGIDSIRFARRVNPKTVLMINASNDETVPRACTEALWQAMGRPAIQWHPAGHYTIALLIPMILPTVLDFVRAGPAEAPRE
jgi:dienelactone hydrolase